MASRFETLQIHAGQEINPVTKSRAVPIYQTAYFNFDDSAHAARCYGLEEDGHIGTRTSNPTTDVLEKRMSALKGGLATVAVASGHFLLPDQGILVDIVQETPEFIEAAINETTRAIYLESMGHPSVNVPDIESIAQVAHRHGIPLVVDNTAGAGGYWCQPILHGADIIRLAQSEIYEAQPAHPGFHNINFHESFRKLAFVNRFRHQNLRDSGACLSPYNSRDLLIGLETLSLRRERHTRNATELAAWLRRHPGISWVDYPGLEDHPKYLAATKYFPRGAGAVILFGVRGGAVVGESLVDGFKLITHMASFGDAKSAATHPWSSTHKPMYPKEKIDLGVTEDMVRMSVGLEHIEDIKQDIQQSLDACLTVSKK
ncbi:Homocysteine synthase [Colletotrichum viniferum]|nr:Homocysteine synthase [Colletotrichum viniferum]